MRIEKPKSKKIELKNDGHLSLFFLGVGSAFTKRQYQTNLLIIKGNEHLLVDCGTKCTQSLFDVGLSITDIKNFLITHSHADHIGGLEEASLMARYFSRTKPTMIIDEIYQDILWNMSLRGGCAYNEEIAGDILTFEDFWDILRPVDLPDYPRHTFEANIGDINIKMIRTKHIPDSSDDWKTSFWSCGLIIDDRILFTSDTRFDRELVEYYDNRFNLELIFHDAQFFTGGVHASIDELNEFSPEIKKKIHLVHYGDNWEKFEKTIKDYGFADLGKQRVFYNFD